MALSAQDLSKGVDFTGINPATGADHNNLIELAVPTVDTAAEGKSIQIWTVDSALDTPIVPDASVTTKWKKYGWIRHPHSTAVSTTPILYVWNENAVSDATYLKWEQVEVDMSAIDSAISSMQADINDALALALAASTTAGVAATNAAAAVITANNANAAAVTAGANAATALTNADEAEGKADQALESLSDLQQQINAIGATANNALANSLLTAATKFFNNGVEYDIVDGVIADVAHGLTARPKFVEVTAICKVAELGYVENDEIDIGYFEDGANDMCPFAVSRNATNIAVVCKQITGLRLSTKATPSILGGPDAANWKIKIYAWA